MSILIGQDGQIMNPCMLSRGCMMHARAETLLAEDRVAELLPDMDLCAVLARRAWRGCTCGMWARIQDAVQRAKERVRVR